MPRLPDVQSLGARPTPGAPRALSLEAPEEAVETAVGGQIMADVGQQMIAASDRIFRREDTLARTSARTQFIEQANQEYQARVTAGGFRTKEDVLAFRNALDEKMAQTVGSLRASPETQAQLQEQLMADRLNLIGEASRASILAQRAEIETGINTLARPVVAAVLSNPSTMGQAFRDVDSIISDYADALAPEDEIGLRSTYYGEIASSAVEGMLISGDVAGAVEVLNTPGVIEALPAERQQAYASQITRLRRAEEERRMERQRRLEDAAFAFNVPVDQMPTWLRVQALGFQMPAAPERPKAQTDLGKLIQDRELFVDLYGENSPQVAAFNELMEGGAEPVDINTESGIRKEFTDQAKDFVSIRDAYNKIQASAGDDSPAGDQALIFSYMKILDPGSTVREGEFATAQNATGVPGRVRNVWNAALSGEILNPDQRKDFRNQALALAKSQAVTHVKLEDEYRRLAEAASVRPESVVVDYMGPELRALVQGNVAPETGGGSPDPAPPPSGGAPVAQYDLQGNPLTASGP